MTLSRPLLALLALGLVAGAGLAAGLAEPPALRRAGDDPSPLQPRASATSHNNSSGDNETRPPPNGTKPAPLPAPVVSPENQSVVARFHQAARFSVVVTNPANQTQNVTVSAHAQLGWSVRVDAFDGNLSPGESVTVTGGVSTLAPLPSRGNVSLVFHGRDASAHATVFVCFVSPLDACPRANATQPPRNDTRPPPNGTDNETGGGNQTRPPSNETQPPQNDTSESSASPGLSGASAEPAGVPVLATRDEAHAEIRAGGAAGEGGGALVASLRLAKGSPTLV